MARVTRRDGRVVLAIANFESLACRVARATDDFREDWLRRPVRRGRRHYDVPADHFTRYDLSLMREQLEKVVRLEAVVGVSLAWGLPAWTRSVDSLPAALADRDPACSRLDGPSETRPLRRRRPRRLSPILDDRCLGQGGKRASKGRRSRPREAERRYGGSGLRPDPDPDPLAPDRPVRSALRFAPTSSWPRCGQGPWRRARHAPRAARAAS